MRRIPSDPEAGDRLVVVGEEAMKERMKGEDGEDVAEALGNLAKTWRNTSCIDCQRMCTANIAELLGQKCSISLTSSKVSAFVRHA